MDESEAVARRAFDLLADGRYEELPPLLHPDVLAAPSQPGTVLRGREAFEEYIRMILRDVQIREAVAFRYERVGEDGVLVSGRLRWSMTNGGFADNEAAWAIRVRDGLIWRFRTTRSREEARAILENDDWSPPHRP
jgi:ketosteroid isomerase-like protein